MNRAGNKKPTKKTTQKKHTQKKPLKMDLFGFFEFF
jgi:hypothetical protein